MSIDKQLKKISKNLQEVALEMEITARSYINTEPKERAGSWIELFSKDGVYKGYPPTGVPENLFIARLKTAPRLMNNEDAVNNWRMSRSEREYSLREWWEAKVIYEGDRAGSIFLESTATWEYRDLGKHSKQYWVLPKKAKSKKVKMPRDWDVTDEERDDYDLAV